MRKAEPSGPAVSRAPARGLLRRTAVAAAIVVGLAGLAVGGYSLLWRGKGVAATASRFESPKMTRLASIQDLTSAALSADRRFLAYVARKSGKYCLWIRQVSTGSDIRILAPQDDAITGLTFSPDGEYLYFLARDTENPIYSALYQVPTLGGSRRKVLFDVDSSVSFSPDGKQIAFMRGNVTPGVATSNALMLAHADGTGERALAVRSFPRSFDATLPPAWSPDGQRIAAMVSDSVEAGQEEIAEFGVTDGKELRIGTKRWESIRALAWLPDHSGIVLVGGEPGETAKQIWFVTWPGGSARKITNDLNQYVSIDVSADSTTLATVQVTVAADLWAAPADNPAVVRRITSGEGSRRWPGVNTRGDSHGGIATAPSGWIVFQAARGGVNEIWGIAPDGTGRRRLSPDGIEGYSPIVARGAGTIVFTGWGADRVGHIWKMSPDVGGPTQLTRGDGEYASAVSPDGKTIVFGRLTDPGFWKAPLDGGPPSRIDVRGAASPSPRYSWDGKYLWLSTPKQKGGRSVLGLGQYPAEGGPELRWIEWPRECDYRFPYEWAPSGDALTCIGELEGVYNLWTQPIAGGEARPITHFKSGHVLDFEWSTDGKRLFLWRGDATTDVVLITNFK